MGKIELFDRESLKLAYQLFALLSTIVCEMDQVNDLYLDLEKIPHMEAQTMARQYYIRIASNF